MNMNPCPFCQIIDNDHEQRMIDQNELAFAILDGYPISDGHTLVIPKRHIASFFDVSSKEREALLELLEKAKLELDNSHQPHAYNIGINDGAAAGQTVAHLHIHLIPRYEGDVDDPRGGVRWIKPDKAVYWDSEK